MWLNKKDWIDFLTASNENRVRATMFEEMIKGQKDTMKTYLAALVREREKCAKLEDRIVRLEEKLLKLNEELNTARKAAVPLQSLNLAEMFEDEDPVRVGEMRARIKAEGADIVLAEAMET